MPIDQSLRRRRATCENPIPASRLDTFFKNDHKARDEDADYTRFTKAFAEQILRFDTDVIANAAKVKAESLVDLCFGMLLPTFCPM